jgi:uncharacterized protein YecT (DUF1311 family)
MKSYILLATLFSIFITLSVSVNAETECAYCGEWVPIKKIPEQPHLAGERLLIDTSTIALPGCANTKIIQVCSGEGYSKTIYNVFKTVDPIKCNRPLPDIPGDTIVEIVLWPRVPGAETLDITLFKSVDIDKLLASYTKEIVTTPSGETQTFMRKPRPKEIVIWHAIRADHDYCSEGSGSGANICANAMLYEEDGKLNSEWRRLTGILSDKERASVVSQQRKWLTAHFRSCNYNNEEGWNTQWVGAFESSCRAKAYSIRAEQLRQAYECISTGKTNCLPLPELAK